jgi:hypothetical protein
MIVSIHQPAYLPWLGYFDRIAKSDTFIFLDTVQFERNSYTNRNRIKTANGPIWLTVPVLLQGHLAKKLTEIEIDEKQDWRKKHLRSIEQNYRRASAFAERFTRLAAQYESKTSHLADLCFDQLAFWLRELAIGARVLRASTLAATGSKSDLVLSLCQSVGATTYLSGPLGRGYLDENQFVSAGIDIRYHDYQHPTYSQLYGEFVPAMAVVDYWMNCPNPNLFTGLR